MNRNHKKLMTLFTKLKMDEDTRHVVIDRFTSRRTHSSKDLTEDETANLIKILQEEINATQTTIADMMRRKKSEVLAIATRTGIKKPDGFINFNAFMLHRSVHKKPLYLYSLEELDDLLRQMHALESNFKKSAKTAGTKAWMKRHNFPGFSGN